MSRSICGGAALTVSIPPSIRFHHGLLHPEGSRWPAMVALVAGAIDNAPAAIHRTFLSRDGTSKAAVGTAKMMLGPCGGGIVRLGGEGRVLLIGEGDRNLPLGHAGDGTSDVGGAFDVRAPEARSP